VSRNPDVMHRVFKVYIRPLHVLEYATCVWSPYYNYAKDKIEDI